MEGYQTYQTFVAALDLGLLIYWIKTDLATEKKLPRV